MTLVVFHLNSEEKRNTPVFFKSFILDFLFFLFDNLLAHDERCSNNKNLKASINPQVVGFEQKSLEVWRSQQWKESLKKNNQPSFNGCWNGSPKFKRWDRWHSPSPNWQEKYHLYTTYILPSGYKWYISGIYCQLGDGLCHLPIPPFKGTISTTIDNHWVLRVFKLRIDPPKKKLHAKFMPLEVEGGGKWAIYDANATFPTPSLGGYWPAISAAKFYVATVDRDIFGWLGWFLAPPVDLKTLIFDRFLGSKGM